MIAGIRAAFAPIGAARATLVYVHGGSHTGACWIATPDGRIGWAPYLAERGHGGYVYDWPGRGPRPAGPEFARQSLEDVASDLARAIETIGERVVLVTHSMGGVLGWRTAELERERIAAIVAIAPGPPANLQPALDAAAIAELQRDEERYARLGRPLIWPEDTPIVTPSALAEQVWMNSTRFPHAHADAYLATLVPESARALNERNNIDGGGIRIAGPEALAGIPIVVITGDMDPRHPRAADAAIADYLGAEFVWLADEDLTGFGHMLMIEDRNLLVADRIAAWLAARER